MGKFFEAHKRDIVLALSSAILLGSGVSLGIGFSQLQVPHPEFQAQGLSQPSQQPDSSVEQAAEFPININTASTLALEALPGIGPSKAAAIAAYREDQGEFKSISEIQNVPGIGPKIYAQIKDLITVK